MLGKNRGWLEKRLYNSTEAIAWWCRELEAITSGYPSLTPHCYEQYAFVVLLDCSTVTVNDLGNFFEKTSPPGFAKRLHIAESQEQVEVVTSTVALPPRIA